MSATSTNIATAARAAFEQARSEHRGEHFYVYALFSEDGDDLQPTCHTEEALARRVKALKQPDADLRWFAEEFEYHQVGDRHFEPLGERPVRRGFGPSVEALRMLDRSGFFGRGKARNAVAVLILRSDQSNREVVQLARKLNPRAVWPRIEAAFEVPEPTGKPRFLPGRDVYSLDSLAVSSDRSVLAAAGWFGGSELFAWKLGKRPRRLPIKKPRDGVRSLTLSPDGRTLYAANDASISRMMLPSGKQLRPLTVENASGLAVSPGGRWLVASVNSRLMRWDLATERHDLGPELLGPICFSPDGKHLAGLSGKGELVVLDTETLAGTSRHRVARRRFDCIALSDRFVAGAITGGSGPITVFKIGARKPGVSLPGHARGHIADLAFSPSGQRLASVGEDGHVRVFDVVTKRLVADVRGRQEAMSAVVFLRDDQVAAVGRDVSQGPPVYVWKIK